MPWEFMGVYIFFGKHTQNMVLHRGQKPHEVAKVRSFFA
jgi:hypothetical protein